MSAFVLPNTPSEALVSCPAPPASRPVPLDPGFYVPWVLGRALLEARAAALQRLRMARRSNVSSRASLRGLQLEAPLAARTSVLRIRRARTSGTRPQRACGGADMRGGRGKGEERRARSTGVRREDGAAAHAGVRTRAPPARGVLQAAGWQAAGCWLVLPRVSQCSRVCRAGRGFDVRRARGSRPARSFPGPRCAPRPRSGAVRSSGRAACCGSCQFFL